MPPEDYIDPLLSLEERVNAKRRSREGYGLPILGPYDAYQIGGPLSMNTFEGQLDFLYDVMPWRAVDRMADRQQDVTKRAIEGQDETGVWQWRMTPEERGLTMLDAADAVGWGVDAPFLAAGAYRHGIRPGAEILENLGEVAMQNYRQAAPGPLGMEAGYIGGQRSAAADMGALDRAIEMKQAGALDDQVYEETGWWLGHPDNQIDIADPTSRMIVPSVNNRGTEGAPTVYAPGARFEIDDSQGVFNWPRATGMFGGKFQMKGNKGDLQRKWSGTLGEIYDDPELYRHYPELADAPVHLRIGTSDSALVDTRGAMDGGDGRPSIRITARESSINDMLKAKPGASLGERNPLSSLKHEIQHLIQMAEDHARGGSVEEFPNAWLSKKDFEAESEAFAGESYIDLVEDMDRRFKNTHNTDLGLQQTIINYFEKGNGQELSLTGYKRLAAKLVDKMRIKGVPDEDIEQFAKDVLMPLGIKIRNRDPLRRYTRLGGEVEARLVEKRAHLTPEERMQSPFWDNAGGFDEDGHWMPLAQAKKGYLGPDTRWEDQLMLREADHWYDLPSGQLKDPDAGPEDLAWVPPSQEEIDAFLVDLEQAARNKADMDPYIKNPPPKSPEDLTWDSPLNNKPKIHPEEFDPDLTFYHGTPRQLDKPYEQLLPGRPDIGREAVFVSPRPAVAEQFMGYVSPKDPATLGPTTKATLEDPNTPEQAKKELVEGLGGGSIYPVQAAPGRVFDAGKLRRQEADELLAHIMLNEDRYNSFSQIKGDGSMAIDPLDPDESYQRIWDYLKSGQWEVVENPVVQEWIKDKGYDSFRVIEGAGDFVGNLGVYDPDRVRSAIRAVKGDPVRYDVEDLKVTPNVPQVPLERVDPPRGKPGTLKGLLGKRTEKRLSEYAKAGEEAGRGWYNLDPLRRQFIEELGPVEGNRQFGRYTEFLAATSPREKVKQNVKRGSLFHYLDRRGKKFAHLRNPGKGDYPSEEIPAGYGSLGHETQRHLLADLEGGGRFSSLTRPKTSSFAENLAGNQAPMTIDTHNIAALTGGKWKRSPSVGEYKYIEQFESDIADKLGMTPAQFQASVWVGAGEDTGVADVRPFIDVFNDVVVETAKKRGITPMEALKEFIRGEKPLLGLAAALSSGTIALESEENDGV